MKKKDGWLHTQAVRAEARIQSWPDWMKESSGLVRVESSQFSQSTSTGIEVKTDANTPDRNNPKPRR